MDGNRVEDKVLTVEMNKPILKENLISVYIFFVFFCGVSTVHALNKPLIGFTIEIIT